MIKFRYDDHLKMFDFVCDTEGEAEFTFQQIQLIQHGVFDHLNKRFYKTMLGKYELTEWVHTDQEDIDFNAAVSHLKQFSFEIQVEYL